MSNIKFYSAWYCPFAQRAWMGLVHKNINHDHIEIDPYEKTPEWMEISRGTGQVPVIIDEGENITVPDSIRVLKYVDTKFPNETSISPAANNTEANAKFWVDFQGSKITPYIYRLLKAEAGSKSAKDAQFNLEQGLQTFTINMDKDGPYFFGKEPGAINVALAPFALRIEILLSHYKEYTLPDTGPIWKRYHQWWDTIRDFKPLKETSTVLPDYVERLVEFYLPYSTGGGQADITQIKQPSTSQMPGGPSRYWKIYFPTLPLDLPMLTGACANIYLGASGENSIKV